MKYSKAQKKAVSHHEGPALILAGPGSGKTFTITHRIKYLVEEYKVNPSEILVITFTKAAAVEMRERFSMLSDGNIKGVTFGTFHSVFFQILKYAYRFSVDNILREETKRELIRTFINDEELDTEDENELIDNVISEISMVKGCMIELDNYYSNCCSEEVFKKIYRQYEKKLRDNRLLDFDDMLVVTYELFRARKDILAGWQKKYRYILIDEFQDINLVQYEIVRMLALPENNLFVVGDDDQSIYGFRGAKPEIMLNFKNHYPGCKEILLDYNYRSDKYIVENALRVIEHNKNRFDKNIKPSAKAEGTVNVCRFENTGQENQRIVSEVRRLHEKGVKWQDMAVLFRTNQGARALVEKFIEYQIPFTMKDRLPNLYEHWIAKDLFAYIAMARGDRTRKTFLQIMNKPKRYIARDYIEQEISFDKLKNLYADKDWMYDRIDRLEYDIRVMETMPPVAAITYFRNAIGYEGYLKEYAVSHRIPEEELIHILDELKESAKNYKDYDSWFAHMEEYKRTLEIIAQNKKEKREDAIEVATLHGAKGLEYSVVFIPDVNEDVIPHKKAGSEGDIEEERRLLYVGMTRAKNILNLYYVKERYNKNLEMSRFLKDMGVRESK
ncbi:MAG: ATP-dependent helicase [Lachnospiraceae bacterium]|nr:ATP-dependent helicase [Lachnospiraceae bacterium]